MSRAARIRQSDVTCILKGAAKAGVGVQVNVKPDGTIEILTDSAKATPPSGALRRKVFGGKA